MGVVLLLVALSVLLDGLPRTLSELAEIAVPVAVVFSLAFAILAVARRVGFVVLWFCVIGLWVWMLTQAIGFAPLSIPMRFVGWSVLAFPLYALGVLGVPTAPRFSILRSRVDPASLVMVGWLALVAFAVHYSGIAPDVLPLPASVAFVRAGARFVWGPAPFIITGLEVVRVWIGSGHMEHTFAAA